MGVQDTPYKERGQVAMVGFVIGLLVGALLGFTLMACLKVGGDDLEQYYIDLIQTYDKEVNRQYKCINKAIEYIEEWQSFPHTNGTTHE